MPRPPRKRQAAAAHAPAGPRSILAFTRLSKGGALLDPAGKEAAVAGLQPAAARKRKAASIEEEADRRLTRRIISFPPSSDEEQDSIVAAPSKRACRRAEPEPKPPSSIRAVAKSRRRDKTVQTKLDGVWGKRPSENNHNHAGGSLPPHLAELVRLNKAFLKTVAMQVAHTNSDAPIDIRTIAPHISRAWGKRQVTIDDIRRCIAIQAHSPRHGTESPFIISDYGRGKVCVELGRGYHGASMHEERLCRQFEENLRALCAGQAVDGMADVHVPFRSLSLADLPQAAITDMAAASNANPVLAKGQRALSDLKSAILAKQQEARQRAASTNPTLNPDGTRMSLLDRLRHKQLAKANGPLPPSGPELQRRAALNRVADVAATISMLSLANPLSLPRQAFTMAGIVEKLRDSLRVPVSREEGVACVRLIAAEVAPEWLRVVAIGGRENVVVQRNAQPVDRVIQERVQKLLAA
ncbi:Uncharacterized protein TCAP_02372 [Tolypocladium capitatum]|uniref:DNA replication factor Cdt1 C-terminal domain-containing protein n=1 Tax=Tolypocladium capitatum TaxID=45235 RepID=A0A2K3QJI4_9HYPO|nr:Uncharacterized protein TCAP_02372 [Tolypocladium capitatum]